MEDLSCQSWAFKPTKKLTKIAEQITVVNNIYVQYIYISKDNQLQHKLYENFKKGNKKMINDCTHSRERYQKKEQGK